MDTISKSACAVVLVLISACGTPAVITGTWHKPGTHTDSYNNIFVAAIAAQTTDKKNIEDDVQRILQQKGLKVEKSSDVFPITVNEAAGKKIDVPISKIKPTGAEGILTITLLRKEKEPHFDPLPPWEPTGDEYIANYIAQYNRYPVNFEFDGYYRNDIVYYVETRFYNTKDQQLIWSAQSKTYDPNNMAGFVKGYVQTIYAQLIKDGVIASGNTRM